MNLDIYKIERNELEIEILNSVKHYLGNIMSSKIKTNSKAYIEINILITNLNERELRCKNKIEENFETSKNNISNLKIETKLLKNLFLLKKEFDCNSVYDVVNALMDYYNYSKYIKKLSKIEICEIPKNLRNNLINSRFNICTNKHFDNKIVYSIDDIIINNDIEYLELEQFKIYSRNGSDNYMFSQNFTLKELDDFYNLVYK